MSNKKQRIQELNDAFRRTGEGGLVVATAGVRALGSVQTSILYEIVRQYDNFNEESDPNGEHDFGSFEVKEHKFFWKIDYYDSKMELGSPDPADPSKTTRVLTIMLAAEY